MCQNLRLKPFSNFRTYPGIQSWREDKESRLFQERITLSDMEKKKGLSNKENNIEQ